MFYRYLLLICMCIGMSACSSSGRNYHAGQTGQRVGAISSIAVLGIIGRDKSLRDFRQKALASDLEASIRIYQPQLGIYPHNHLRRDLDSALKQAGSYAGLLNRYQTSGTLTDEDWQLLKPVATTVRYLVVASIDEDKTTRFEPQPSPVRNRRGEVLLDQRRMTLFHERTVAVSATTFDLQEARVVWSGSFISKPASSRVYTEYTGSSFSGSVAAMLANSFVNGRASTRYPDAPGSVQAIRKTFKNIGRELLGNR